MSGEQALTAAEIEGFADTVDVLQFTERCDITRDGQTERDELNQPRPPEPAVLFADLVCHYFERTRRELVGPDIVATIVDTRLIVPAGLDVAERDTVAEVRNADGSKRAGPRRIDRVLPRSYYTEILLAGANNAG